MQIKRRENSKDYLVFYWLIYMCTDPGMECSYCETDNCYKRLVKQKLGTSTLKLALIGKAYMYIPVYS